MGGCTQQRLQSHRAERAWLWRWLRATVVLPKLLLGHLSGATGTGDYERLLRDNYESSVAIPAGSESLKAMDQIAGLMRLSVSDFVRHARTVSSPDELSLFLVQHIMRELAPRLIWVTLHDIDVAHSGAFSLYSQAIVRSDRICAELWSTIQTEPEYKGKTNLLILPDFGRDADTDAGGNGFQHHRTGDALSRTTWLIALGPGIRENVTVDRPVESIDLVPTLGRLLQCDTPMSPGRVLQELLV